MTDQSKNLDDIIDDNQGPFFDALRSGGFKFIKGDKSRGAYSKDNYRLIYETRDNSIFEVAVFDIGEPAITSDAYIPEISDIRFLDEFEKSPKLRKKFKELFGDDENF
ncbi:hypothetical protein J4221_02730 [Candidatus Pacearchaeota archaeon]|nr:hypothetical protein [Candidatus Pacearchaeota archaeon]